MRVDAILFPGQGAQKVGMGRDVFELYEAAREVFEQASAAIDVDMRRVCFEGPGEDLGRTDLCQPAILTASVAILRATERQLGRSLEPDAAAGLSLGEYSALVAAGALGLGDAVRLVYARGRYMQEACETERGAMYSVIGLEDAQVVEACRQVQQDGGRVWPANYNSPGQLVISGEGGAARRAAGLCGDAGARRVVQLKVAGAFHTPLMESAARQLAEDLGRTAFHEPTFPVVANVTAVPASGPTEIRELLARQVTSPVRWAQSMRWCAAYGARSFLELGPGRVLQSLLKRIEPDARCTSVGSAEEVAALAASL